MTATFQYDPAFLRSGIELSPIVMPLRPAAYSFPGLAQESFHGLPGLLADSLPDRFGNAIVDAWLASQGRAPSDFNAVERLCYTGARGMGALEFIPARGPEPGPDAEVEVAALVALASQVLSDRETFVASLAGSQKGDGVADILRVGTSAGGARAKAVIAFHPGTGEVRSGQVHPGDGFEHWIIKFDGVRGNKDKELDDPRGYGTIEYAYFLMARAAGVVMSDCRMFGEGGRRHFMARRFDRLSDGDKLHVQSFGALCHFDFNAAGAHSYEQVMLAIRRLGMDMETIEQMFRRMAFNIVARNQDDHVKNIAFLMDRSGRWTLAPAFDVTYSYAPSGAWTGRHQMSLNTKRDDFTRADFSACGQVASLRRGRARAILDEVIESVGRWSTYADAAAVAGSHAEKIARTLRLDIPAR